MKLKLKYHTMSAEKWKRDTDVHGYVSCDINTEQTSTIMSEDPAFTNAKKIMRSIDSSKPFEEIADLVVEGGMEFS